MLPSLSRDSANTTLVTPQPGQDGGNRVSFGSVEDDSFGRLQESLFGEEEDFDELEDSPCRRLRGKRPGRTRLIYLNTGSSTSGAEFSGEDELNEDNEDGRDEDNEDGEDEDDEEDGKEDEDGEDDEEEDVHDDESIQSIKAEPLPVTQPNHNDGQSNFLERYQHENKWLELKSKPIPKLEPDRSKWVDEWFQAFQEGVRLKIPRFVNDGSKMAILDFLAAVDLQDAETLGELIFMGYKADIELSGMSETFHFESILLDFMLLRSDREPATTTQGEDKSHHIKEMDQIREDWYGLCFSNFPSTEYALDAWLEKWRLTYDRGVALKIPSFIEDNGKEAIYTFLYRVKNETGFSWFLPCYRSELEFNDPVPSFASILDDFQLEWIGHKEVAEEKAAEAKKKCVCGLKNHQKWVECYYLNSSIRPEGWIPKPTVMARIDEQARTDRKLKNFIRKHRKKQSPPPPEQEEPKKEEKPKDAETEEEKEAKRGPIQVIFPHLSGEALETNEKIKTSFFVFKDSPIHFCNDRSRFVTFKQRDPTLPQNRIHCMDPFKTTIGIHGVGRVKVKATTPDGVEKGVHIELHEVKYCPEAPWNAISIDLFNSWRYYFDEVKLMFYYITNKERKYFAKVEERFGRRMLEYNLVE